MDCSAYSKTPSSNIRRGTMLKPDMITQGSDFYSKKKNFTKEEEMLKSKYEILRNLKLKLHLFEKNKMNIAMKAISSPLSPFTSQIELKKSAVEILKASGGLKSTFNSEKLTTDFKKATKQNGETSLGQKRCAMGEYVPEAETLPRCVTIRGHDLTIEFLRRAFEKFGDIWKVRMGHNNQSALITFRTSDSASLAANTMNGCIVEDKQLHVDLMKKRNSSWVELSAAEGRDRKQDYSNREKRTVHVAYQGKLSVNDFHNIFNPFGAVEKVYLSDLSKMLSTKKQFAFVTFEYEDEARRAVVEMNGEFVNGIRLIVSPQKPVFNDSSISMTIPLESDSRELVTFTDVDGFFSM